MRCRFSSFLSLAVLVGFITLCGFTMLTQSGSIALDYVIGGNQFVPRQLMVQKTQVVEYYSRSNRKTTQYAYVQIEASDDSGAQTHQRQILSHRFDQLMDAAILASYYPIGQRAIFYYNPRDPDQFEFNHQPAQSAGVIAFWQALYLIGVLVIGSGVLAIFILLATETRFGDYWVDMMQRIARRVPLNRKTIYIVMALVGVYGLISGILLYQYRSSLYMQTYQSVIGRVTQAGVHVLGKGENAATRTGMRPIAIFSYRVGDTDYVGAGMTDLALHPLGRAITVYVDMTDPTHFALTRDKPIYFALLLIPVLIMLVVLAIKTLRKIYDVLERYLPNWLGASLLVGVGMWMFLQLFIGGVQAMYWLNGNQKALVSTSFVIIMPLFAAGLCMTLAGIGLGLNALWMWARERLGR